MLSHLSASQCVKYSIVLDLFYLFVYIECILPSFHIIPGIFILQHYFRISSHLKPISLIDFNTTNMLYYDYVLKDNYKQKQFDIFPVIIITEIMHFNILLW